MRTTLQLRNVAGLSFLTVAALVAGCNSGDADKQSPTRAAKEALKIEGASGPERTVETRRDVDVIETTKVVDRKTGEVITTKQEVTPVTVQKTREVKTQVQEGKTTKTVE